MEERFPGMLAPHLLKLRILLEVGETATALSLAETLRKGAPDHFDVQLYWAEAVFRGGQPADARASLLALAEKSTGEDSSKAYQLLAKIERELGRPDVAQDLLRKATEANPGSGELILELCQMYLLSGASQEAVSLLEDFAQNPAADVGMLLSGAMISHNHGLGRIVRVLSDAALHKVLGGPAEEQVRAVIRSIGGGPPWPAWW
jgi:predicted Zn-dependent protease